MGLSGKGVDILPAGGRGKVEGDLASRLNPAQAGRWEDSTAAGVERIGG